MPFAPILEPLKAGDSFGYEGSASLPVGAWEGTAQVRDKKTGALVSDLTVKIGESIDGEADIELAAPASETAAWLPPRRRSRACIFDIQFRNTAGEVAHTDTIEFSVVSPVTRRALP